MAAARLEGIKEPRGPVIPNGSFTIRLGMIEHILVGHIKNKAPRTPQYHLDFQAPLGQVTRRAAGKPIDSVRSKHFGETFHSYDLGRLREDMPTQLLLSWMPCFIKHFASNINRLTFIIGVNQNRTVL